MRKEQGDWQARGWNNLKPEHLCRLCSTHVERSYWDQEPRFGNRAREGWKMAVLKLSFTPAYRLSLEMRRESPWTAQRQVLEILASVFSATGSWSQFMQPWPAWQWEGCLCREILWTPLETAPWLVFTALLWGRDCPASCLRGLH